MSRDLRQFIVWVLMAGSSALAAQETTSPPPATKRSSPQTAPASTDAPIAPAATSTDDSGASRPPAQSGPYWIRVTGNEVNLRSRPDQNSLAVVRLPRESVLRAVDSEFGWHRVLPPDGVFSYVHGDYVTQTGPDAGTVSVQSGNLRVRVGSFVVNNDPERSDVQVLLPAGAPVRILGRSESWLKIAPPAGVYYYVSGQFSEPISNEDAQRLGGVRFSSTGTPERAELPSSPGAESSLSGSDLAMPTSPAAQSAQPTGPWDQRLAAIEADIAAEARRPLGVQDWSDLITRLQPIASQTAELQPAAKANEWLTDLRQRAAQKAPASSDEPPPTSASTGAAMPGWRSDSSVLGELARTAVFVNGVRTQRLCLQFPDTKRPIVYLEFPATSQIRIDDFLGQMVTASGRRRVDRLLGGEVLVVERMVAGSPAIVPRTANPPR